jgi:hypothetical protein
MPIKHYLPTFTGPSTFRIDVPAQARFAGEYTALIAGMSLSAILERGAMMLADAEAERRGKDWREVWDRAKANPAAAWILMLTDRSLPLDTRAQQYRNFFLEHEQFFFSREGKTLLPKTRNIEVLYKHIDAMVTHWEKTKSVDTKATAEKLAELLKKAGIKPPAYGPNAE